MTLSNHADTPDHDTDLLSERIEVLREARHTTEAESRGVFPAVTKAVADARPPEPAKPIPFWLVVLLLLSPGLAIGLGTLVAHVIFVFFDAAGKAVASL